MIGYVTLGVRDLERARKFYSALLGDTGARELLRAESGFTMYGKDFDKPMLAITLPWNGEEASAGNGTMVGLSMFSPLLVDHVYKRALELGGTSEGEPGLRSKAGEVRFYACYFRDTEGNKLCAYSILASSQPE